MREDDLAELTSEYLVLANGKNAAVVIGACFGVIHNICNSMPELCLPTAEFMESARDLLKERTTYEHTH